MKIAQVLILFTLLAGALPVRAALGDTVGSVVSDQRRLEGQLRSTQLQGYQVHEITRTDGTKIREYLSPAGRVFGVSWTAPTLPNLSELLGSSFPLFQSVTNAKVHRRGSAVVRNGDLVVESAGRMRNFHGRAYLNTLLPSGVSETVVQ